MATISGNFLALGLGWESETKMAIKIAADIQWKAKQSSTSSRWIGVCEPMNLAIEADSLEELRTVISEAIQLLFVDLLEDNELSTFLEERGWQVVHDGPGAGDGVEFDVPWELLVAGNTRDSQHQAN